jgi:hypothetical protein
MKIYRQNLIIIVLLINMYLLIREAFWQTEFSDKSCLKGKKEKRR